jgi:uncharacterized membrane protein (TIGR01666 family)
MTAGILLPAFIMSYFDLLATGIVMSVGALCVAATDNPGPAGHRISGMLICNALIFITAIIVEWAVHSPVILSITLFVFCFIFSMLGVYGARATSIGIAALLVMVLNLQHPRQGLEIIVNASYILAGGLWYMLFSVLLHRLRPYKIIQQILGDCIQSTAEYLRTRANFYNKDVEYQATYNQLLIQQARVQQMENMLSELLFKTRTIVQESTHKGRILVMMYLEVADLFERVMTSYQQYNVLHNYFDSTDILEDCKKILLLLADELDEIGTAVKSGTQSHEIIGVLDEIKKARAHYQQLRLNFMTPDNLEGFVSLGRIFEAIQDLSERINILRHYTTYDPKLKKKSSEKISYEKLIEREPIEPDVFFDNLNFNSNIFRHSLRVSFAVIFGYLISLMLHTGHSYWILLTIIVILKPAYSLTKQRNKDRLIGTALGILIGVTLLFFIKNDTALLVLMIVFMTGCYIFLRTNYFISVMLMTPYLLLFFHLLYPADFKVLLTDRAIDTAIGSAIAFIASVFFIPKWERTTIKTYLIKMIEENREYLTVTAESFISEQPLKFNAIRIARKRALVALANLSDAFNRMLSEPRRHKKGIEILHRFVVLNYTFVSHVATLSYYLQTMKNVYRSSAFEPVINDTVSFFTNAINMLENRNTTAGIPSGKQSIRVINEQTEILMEKRRQELHGGLLETDTKNLLIQTKPVTDQFNYIYSIASDINKVSREINVE